jgi:hypothetical protein
MLEVRFLPIRPVFGRKLCHLTDKRTAIVTKCVICAPVPRFVAVGCRVEILKKYCSMFGGIKKYA